MKRLLTAIVMLAVAAAAQISCEKYEDGKPSKNGRSEFERMYPDAKDVEWDREGMYWSVSFETGSYSNRVDHEALFDTEGNWIYTETDMYMSLVPQSIKGFLEANPEYGILPLDDKEVEYYQIPSGNFYRFDLKLAGRDIDVDVTEDGKVSLAKKLY